jgi:hypothetical protein
MTSHYPVIRPESTASAEITFYKDLVGSQCGALLVMREFPEEMTSGDNLLLADANTFAVARREFVFRPLRKSSRHTVIFSICSGDVSHIGVGVTPF